MDAIKPAAITMPTAATSEESVRNKESPVSSSSAIPACSPGGKRSFLEAVDVMLHHASEINTSKKSKPLSEFTMKLVSTSLDGDTQSECEGSAGLPDSSRKRRLEQEKRTAFNKRVKHNLAQKRSYENLRREEDKLVKLLSLGKEEKYKGRVKRIIIMESACEAVRNLSSSINEAKKEQEKLIESLRANGCSNDEIEAALKIGGRSKNVEPPESSSK